MVRHADPTRKCRDTGHHNQEQRRDAADGEHAKQSCAKHQRMHEHEIARQRRERELLDTNTKPEPPRYDQSEDDR